jgi:glycosyltransferase involved in cell wall biosynthesis
MPTTSSHASKAPTEAADTPLVSVGMPVFNCEAFLRQAIDSMLAQSHANLELIISDNASTDGSAAIIAEYASRDPRVRCFLQSRNTGSAWNHNFVAACARGKYLKWASANDYCDAAMLAACVEVLESEPRAVLCYGTTCLVDEVTGAKQSFDGDFSVTEERPSARFCRVLLEMRLNNAFNGLIRMEALAKTGLNRSYPAGDLVLMTELAMAGTFVLLPRPFLYRRIGPHTSSSQLSDTELRYFVDPKAKSNAGLDWLRVNIDRFMSVMRASMSFREKQRALRLLACSAYWAVRKMLSNPQRK